MAYLDPDHSSSDFIGRCKPRGLLVSALEVELGRTPERENALRLFEFRFGTPRHPSLPIATRDYPGVPYSKRSDTFDPTPIFDHRYWVVDMTPHRRLRDATEPVRVLRRARLGPLGKPLPEDQPFVRRRLDPAMGRLPPDVPPP